MQRLDASQVRDRRAPLRSLCTALVVAAMIAGTSMPSVRAAPPTVTPSPGYDARLQEQRAAATMDSHVPAVARHGTKRIRHRAN